MNGLLRYATENRVLRYWEAHPFSGLVLTTPVEPASAVLTLSGTLGERGALYKAFRRGFKYPRRDTDGGKKKRMGKIFFIYKENKTCLHYAIYEGGVFTAFFCQ